MIDQNHKCVDAPVSITGKQLKKLRTEIDDLKIILKKHKFGIKNPEKGAKIFKRKKIY